MISAEDEYDGSVCGGEGVYQRLSAGGEGEAGEAVWCSVAVASINVGNDEAGSSRGADGGGDADAISATARFVAAACYVPY